MHVVNARSAWLTKPGQDKVPEAERLAYHVIVPSYYVSVAFRDRLAREFGPAPSPLEVLNEVLNQVPAVYAEAEVEDVERLVTAGLLDAMGTAILDDADRRALGDVRRRMRRESAAVREMEADAGLLGEIRALETVREFVFEARNLVDRDTGEPVVLPTEEADGGGRLRLTREGVELIPETDIQWLNAELQALSSPRGTAIKNFKSRSSRLSKPTPSMTAASSQETARPDPATNGTSPISSTTAPAGGSGIPARPKASRRKSASSTPASGSPSIPTTC